VRRLAPDLDVAIVEVESAHGHCHLHSWRVELARCVARDQLIGALHVGPRVAVVRMSDGVLAELICDLGCRQERLGDVAVWEDLLTVEGRDAFLTCQVFDEATILRETVDAVRAVAARRAPGRRRCSAGARPARGQRHR